MPLIKKKKKKSASYSSHSSTFLVFYLVVSKQVSTIKCTLNHDITSCLGKIYILIPQAMWSIVNYLYKKKTKKTFYRHAMGLTKTVRISKYFWIMSFQWDHPQQLKFIVILCCRHNTCTWAPRSDTMIRKLVSLKQVRLSIKFNPHQKFYIFNLFQI